MVKGTSTHGCVLQIRCRSRRRHRVAGGRSWLPRRRRNASVTQVGDTATHTWPSWLRRWQGWRCCMQTSRAPRRVTSGARPARPAWRRWRPAGLAWALWALAMLSVPMAAWLDHLLRQAGRPDLLELTPTAIPPVLGAVSAATVGAVLATRRPRHPAGWLLLALGLSLSASGPAEAYTNYAVASPGAPPAASLVALYMPATVVTAFACIGFVLLLTPTGTLPSPRWRWWARAMVATLVALLPLAIGAAVLRYRLYDLDRIISRTLAYGLLTVLLGGAYAGVVLGFGELLGQDSSLVVAGATLAVAALFQPARRRIQQVVDRRFNRRRYDAARTIEGFSARLRQQVDLDTLTGELLGVVEQTVQPTSVSLWLRASVSTAPDQPSTGPSRATAVGRISRRASGERSSEPA